MAIQSITQDSAFESFDGGSGGGGGSSGGGFTTSPTITSPVRTITFNVDSTPNGAAIYVNDVNSGFTTPHTLQYTELELLVSNKRISLVLGSEKSAETYVLTSEIVKGITSITGGSGGSSGGTGGGSYGSGAPNNNNYK